MPEILRDSKGKVVGLTSTWTKDDVETVFEDMFSDGYPNLINRPTSLTNEEIEEVCCNLVDHFDASQGINWKTIEYCIEDVLENREEEKEVDNAKT